MRCDEFAQCYRFKIQLHAKLLWELCRQKSFNQKNRKKLICFSVLGEMMKNNITCSFCIYSFHLYPVIWPLNSYENGKPLVWTKKYLQVIENLTKNESASWAKSQRSLTYTRILQIYYIFISIKIHGTHTISGNNPLKRTEPIASAKHTFPH